MKIFITGDSHTAALKRAASAIEGSGDLPTGIELGFQPLGGAPNMRRPFFKRHENFILITDRIYSKRISRIPPDDNFFDAFAVCAGFNPRPLLRHRNWTLVASGVKGYVSKSLMRRAIYDDMTHVLGFYANLKEIGLKVFSIQSPMPFRLDPDITKLGAEFVVDFYKDYRKLAFSELQKIGIPVIEVPEECVDASGLMLDSYASEQPEDHNHANVHYGKLMLEKMLKTMTSGRSDDVTENEMPPGSN